MREVGCVGAPPHVTRLKVERNYLRSVIEGRQRIRRRVEQILKDPYTGTERLGRVTGGLDCGAAAGGG